MSARIARGSKRSPARATTRRSPARKTTKQQGALESLGIPAETVRRATFWAVIGLIAAIAVAAAAAFRLPQLAGTAIGEGVGSAGFHLRRVEVTGFERVSRLDVYNVAFDQPSMAMPLVDLDATRARLLEFGWIKEARVSRRLPDTLVVELVERRPAAIWQHNRQLNLIDAEGVVLEPVKLEAMPDLPLVIGPAANHHVPELTALLASAPHVRPQVTGATWIGGRRWDLRFQTGEMLALPEGDEAARRALAAFARMDQQTQLLGRGFVRFDMRIPGRFIVRVTRDPGRAVPEIAPPPAEAPAQDLSRTI